MAVKVKSVLFITAKLFIFYKIKQSEYQNAFFYCVRAR